MKRLMVMAGVCLALAGCGERFETARGCYRSAGHRDTSGAAIFGPIGAVALLASDEDRAWRARFEDCVNIAKAEGRL